MKNSLIVFLLFICFGFATKQESITWNANQKLTWQNFKAKAPKISSYRALSAVGISAGFSFNEKEIKISIESFFDPKQSWTKDQKSEYLLNHEQKHFDISEIHARKLRKACSEAKWSSKNVSKTFNALRQKYSAEENKMQEQYDGQTKHSINEEAQKEWDKKIKEELYSLKDYSVSNIIISDF